MTRKITLDMMYNKVSFIHHSISYVVYYEEFCFYVTMEKAITFLEILYTKEQIFLIECIFSVIFIDCKNINLRRFLFPCEENLLKSQRKLFLFLISKHALCVAFCKILFGYIKLYRGGLNGISLYIVNINAITTTL